MIWNVSYLQCNVMLRYVMESRFCSVCMYVCPVLYCLVLSVRCVMYVGMYVYVCNHACMDVCLYGMYVLYVLYCSVLWCVVLCCVGCMYVYYVWMDGWMDGWMMYVCRMYVGCMYEWYVWMVSMVRMAWYGMVCMYECVGCIGCIGCIRCMAGMVWNGMVLYACMHACMHLCMYVCMYLVKL